MSIEDFTLSGLIPAKRWWIVQSIVVGNPNVRIDANPNPQSRLQFTISSAGHCSSSVTSDYVADTASTTLPVQWNGAVFTFAPASNQLFGWVLTANGTAVPVVFDSTSSGVKCTVTFSAPSGVWTGTHP